MITLIWNWSLRSVAVLYILGVFYAGSGNTNPSYDALTSPKPGAHVPDSIAHRSASTSVATLSAPSERCQYSSVKYDLALDPTSCVAQVTPTPEKPIHGFIDDRPQGSIVPLAGVCYVNVAGQDAANGRSWDNAKQSLMACYDSLSADGGTIFFSDGGVYSGSQVQACTKDDPPGCGIWIMGKKDPNYAHPPRGWRRAKHTVSFVGVGGSSFGANSRFGGKAGVRAGSGVDRYHPSVWLSAVANVVFRNMVTFSTSGIQPLRGIVVGETSDHDRRGAGSCSTITFDNVDPSLFGGPGSGPGVDITGSSFWITIQNSLVTGAYGQSTDSDNRAAILIDGTVNAGNGLVFVTDTNVNGGGVKYIPGQNPGSLVVRDLTIEGDFSHDIPPAIWIAGTGTMNGTTVTVDNITVADHGPSGAAALEVDGGFADNCTAIGVAGAGTAMAGVNVRGPCTIVGQFQSYNLAASNENISPLRRGQSGTILGHLIGQTDAARRAFSPVSVRFPNLVSQLPSHWPVSRYDGNTSVLTEIKAPDGTTNAGRAESHNGHLQESLWFTPGNGHLAQRIMQGDWYIMGAWVRSVTANGYSQSNTQALGFDIDGAPSGTLAGTHSSAPNRGDGEWEWQWVAEKVIATPRENSYVQFSAHFDNTHSIEAYAPILLHIPAHAVSDNEAYELAVNLQSYPDTAGPGDVSTLRGERLSVGGSTDFFAKLTHSCSADCIQLFPNSPGPNRLAATNVSQEWNHEQEFRAGLTAGKGTPLSRYARFTAELSPSPVLANNCAAQSFKVDGVLEKDVLIAVNKPSEQPGLSVSSGHVAGNNLVNINFCNNTNSAITPTQKESYNFVVVQ
jgi:hypothetical protein